MHRGCESRDGGGDGSGWGRAYCHQVRCRFYYGAWKRNADTLSSSEVAAGASGATCVPHTALPVDDVLILRTQGRSGQSRFKGFVGGERGCDWGDGCGEWDDG